ncbi:DEKNAAC105466 [Brettanomyces naardenensis]|uniref:Delta 8-(E)-sphingolipid desaturase n=1 Tax=Brettanomyces naardenensis TaxID=13370 RepID=A0A448YTD4_BRENA|nr:DEKNAAC105466 [Brettanomyces naardenensis]
MSSTQPPSVEQSILPLSPPSASTKTSPLRVLSVDEIKHLIAQGHAIIIYGKYVLKLDHWLKYHPGGDKAVHHMIGRDAMDEMNCYHSPETISHFKKFSIGVIDHRWINLLPPIQGGIYDDNDQNYEERSKKGDLMSGEMKVEIRPKMPQGVIPKPGMTELYKIVEPTKQNPIRDPKVIIDNFDNRLVKEDLDSIPPLDYDTQWFISLKYGELHDTCVKAGMFDCPYIEYFKQFCINLTLFNYFLIFFKLEHYFFSAIFLGFFWQQLVFIAHDAGHMAITHNFEIDNIVGTIIANWIGGLSLGWWKRNHNIHHLMTNDPVADPDIQHLPFFCVSSRLFGNLFSTYYERHLWFDKFAQKLIPLQSYLYYPILAFGRFNLYRLSLEYLIKGQGPRNGQAAWFRWFELAGLAFFCYWFFYLVCGSLPTSWDKFQYIMVSHIATMIVHVQITLSHFAMSTSDLGVSESFASRQMRTTMDVDCAEWFDFFHGGLQYQAVHHLFPRMPRHNLRKAQKYVMEFCKETGLKYSIYGFVHGNAKVLVKMSDVGKQVGIFRDCLRSMKMEDMGGRNMYERRVASATE